MMTSAVRGLAYLRAFYGKTYSINTIIFLAFLSIPVLLYD